MSSGARTAYLAPEGFAAELQHELADIEFAHERLLIAAGRQLAAIRVAVASASRWPVSVKGSSARPRNRSGEMPST